MASGYEIANIIGIPIRVHITLILFFPYFLFQMMAAGMNFFASIFGVVFLFGSVALHELGHSAAAHYYGYRVRQIILFPIGGVAMLEQLPRKPIEELIIALAGPAVSLALALCGFLLLLTGGLGIQSLWLLFMILAGVNTMLFLFNLIPSFPMDGGRVFRALMTPRMGRVRATYTAMRLGRFLAMMFGIFGLFGLPGIIPPFSITLILIAIFIYVTAGAEYRAVVMQERMQGMNPLNPFTSLHPSEDEEGEHDFSVGPAPYERDRVSQAENRFRKWFADLFRDYDQ